MSPITWSCREVSQAQVEVQTWYFDLTTAMNY
jgi:hypothetical protein